MKNNEIMNGKKTRQNIVTRGITPVYYILKLQSLLLPLAFSYFVKLDCIMFLEWNSRPRTILLRDLCLYLMKT